jgi:hypothetical protein
MTTLVSFSACRIICCPDSCRRKNSSGERQIAHIEALYLFFCSEWAYAEINLHECENDASSSG